MREIVVRQNFRLSVNRFLIKTSNLFNHSCLSLTEIKLHPAPLPENLKKHGATACWTTALIP